MPKRIHLAFDFSYAHMGGRWRSPLALGGMTYPDIGIYEEVARLAERGCLDMLFSGDGTGVPDTWKGQRDAAVEWGMNWPRQDLNPIMVALSRVTKHLGFGLTYSSTFIHPYYVARLMNSLDHLTGGRIALNVVTSTRKSDFANFGMSELMDHGARYDRMEEFISVCNALWASAEPDAMLWDRMTGRVTDPAKIHDVHHDGRFFKVDGPLNTPPSPQGKPVLIQAGGSARGIRASAQFVDHAFGADMPLPLQVKQRALFDQELAAAGRDPQRIGILWQTPIVVAETMAEAIARKESLLSMIPQEAAGAYLSYNCGYDFSKLPQRFTVAELHAEIVAAQASPVGFVHELGVKLGMDTEITRKEFFDEGIRFATAYDTTIAGTGASLADHLEMVFEATGSRGGFMLGHTVSLLQDLAGIVTLLVPELQRRGRFRREYTGRTLRENLSEE